VVRAAVYHGRGDIRVEDVREPADPGPGELVLAVVRASICGTDAAEWSHGPHLARSGVTLGHEFTGTVLAAGTDSGGLRVGDRVVSGAGVSCGTCGWCRAGRTNLCASYYTLGLQADGGLAELVCTPAAICHRVPDGCSDEAAAMAQPLAVALHAVTRSGVEAGETVAVIGAGGIGALVIFAAAARGARVIAIDVDEQRLETARVLGAQLALDARAADLAELVLEATAREGAGVVIEASGAQHAPAAATRAVRRGGRVLLVGLQAAPRELDLLALTLREVSLETTVAHVCAVDVPAALELLATGTLADDVLGEVIALEELVEAGIRPLADGVARGKTVVALSSAP
jgi:(R,R)-butanediol dehydrogenase/meso-butanediol dehydrogenase/diacetyl reductase